ncbi:MAG: hypothetical protein AB7O97_11825 [Planctomycetota bacterium]
MTTTHHAPHAPHGPAGGTHRPEPLDPENDIDAKSTSWWVLGSAIVLFIGLYFLLPLFDAILQHERQTKINERPALELQEVDEAETSFLNGFESSSGKSIDQVMREMVEAR